MNFRKKYVKTILIIGFFAIGLTVAPFKLKESSIQSIALASDNKVGGISQSVLLSGTNKERAKENLPALAENNLLQKAAQKKAEDMAKKAYFSHNTPDGVTPWRWIKNEKYAYQSAGENLAEGFDSAADVVRGWMDSPTHRDNLMNSNFTEIGFGLAEGKFKGEKVVFVVVFYARPAKGENNFLKILANMVI